MTDTFSDLLAVAADRRLARFLPSSSAAFVFEPRGRQVLWGNAAGLDEAGEHSLFSLRARRVDLDQLFAAEIARAAVLAPEAEPGQIHIIRFPWGAQPRSMAWRARRLGHSDGWGGLLLVGAEQSGRRPDRPLVPALLRLFPDGPVAVLDRNGTLAGAAPTLDEETQTALGGPLGPALVHAATGERPAIVEHALPDRVLRLAAIRIGGEVAEAILAVLIATEARPPRPKLVPLDRHPRPAARGGASVEEGHLVIRRAGRACPQLLDDKITCHVAEMTDDLPPQSEPRITGDDIQAFFAELPMAMAVFRGTEPLFATRAFLDLFGYSGLTSFTETGSLDAFLPGGSTEGRVSAVKADGSRRMIALRRVPVPWAGRQAHALVAEPAPADPPPREDTAAARRIGDVLAGIGREIRTPLNAMFGTVELMVRERHGPIGDDRYRDSLRDMLAGGTHMIGLLDGLVDLAGVESRRGDRALERLVVNDLVRASAALAHPIADRAQVGIRLGLARGTPMVRGDRASLQRSVIMLISSAVGVTPSGGQVIASTTVTGGVTIRVRNVGTGPELDLAAVLAEASEARLSIVGEAEHGSIAEIRFA